MVRWFDPLQLIQTGIRKAISETFGDYADKRELQAALVLDVEVSDGKVLRKSAAPLEYPRVAEGDSARRDGGDVWIDYVADLGDGFEATYTIAYLLAQPELSLQGGQALPRGDILVMGGDQVYPTPSRAGYENKLIGPYSAALPRADPAPDLYAIPGNHDWYDGLANFLRFFCMKRRIGGWETRQGRSYFAAKLPGHWWLWGIDIQFEGYIDEPQLEYFDAIAKTRLEPGDRVLLVTGKPSWMDAPAEESHQYENLKYLEEKVIETRGRGRTVAANPPWVPVMISGDDHYYAHYYRAADSRWRRKITSGGGGAFLSATHHMRRELTLPRGDDGSLETYTLKKESPSRVRSWFLGLRTLWLLPWRNWVFLWAVAVAYLGPALLLQSKATQRVGGDERAGFGEFWGDVMWTEWAAWAGAIVWALLFLYAAVKSVFWRAVVAGAHATAHVFVIGTATAFSAWVLDRAARRLAEDNPFRNAVIEGDLTVALCGALVATIPGAIVVGLYLILMDLLGLGLDRFFPRRSQRFPRHVMELFAAQRITGHKNFLRIRIDGETGSLTIYPIAVPKARKFEFPAADDPRHSYLVPKNAIQWRLIEQPIVVGGQAEALADLVGAPVD
jgi:Calcineurin-like phosphoesterase